ncbi:hypothetical protein PILCRDRAFT_194686 [Piloderma croceum F 1598]|uniref:Uncharacterized protein n=1 Tax=Piloderma croceum (strain F 1598) TaxID=765440 RepID=A0A0C3G0L1_PILCF|nr:hypothetical protein PILCRDRAFT_194686 [Piloderma croceum F 1598]
MLMMACLIIACSPSPHTPIRIPPHNPIAFSRPPPLLGYTDVYYFSMTLHCHTVLVAS